MFYTETLVNDFNYDTTYVIMIAILLPQRIGKHSLVGHSLDLCVYFLLQT